MNKVTYDMLDEFSDAHKTIFRLLYPDGLTMEQLAEKAEQFNWHRVIYERVKGD